MLALFSQIGIHFNFTLLRRHEEYTGIITLYTQSHMAKYKFDELFGT